MTVEIIRRDLGVGAIRSASKATNGKAVAFGSTGPKASDLHIDGETGEVGDISVAGLLGAHEFGIGVPERSVIRAYVASQPSELKGAVKATFREVVNGTTPSSSITRTGELAVKGLRKRIEQRIPPPLEASTLTARERESELSRGSEGKPLKDTEQILDSLGFRVE